MLKIWISVILGFGLFMFSCNNQAQTKESQGTKSKLIQSNPLQKKEKSAKAPDFALKNSEGKVIRLSSFEDKVIILNFWATWCGPCRQEIPGFVELYKKYNDKGLEIIGVSVDQNGWKAVKPFIENYKINYTVLMFDYDVVRNYGGIDGIPTTFVINRKGEIVEKIIGLRPDSYFESKVKELL